MIAGGEGVGFNAVEGEGFDFMAVNLEECQL